MSASREKKQRQGSGPSEKAAHADQKQAAYKRKVRTYTAIGVVVVVLVAALLIWNSGFFQSRATAATIGDNQLSVGELGYYYQNARYKYAASGMIDSNIPDDEQIYNEEEGTTYRDFFLETALENARNNYAIYEAAIAAGHTQDEIQEDLDASIEAMKTAASNSSYTYKSYLVANYGKYMTPAIYEKITAMTLLSNLYANEVAEEFFHSYTEEELEAYYEEHPDDVDEIEYSYLYFTPADVEDTDEDGNELTEEEIEELETQALADAKDKAEQALAAYQDGETDVAALIEEYEPNTSGDHTVATGTANISSGYQEELLALDEGEAALVENGESGYYVVIFHSRGRNEDLTADVRHILFRAETTTNEDGDTVAPTDEAWAAALAEAEEVLAQYEAGDKTAESFGELADEYSEDTGSNTNGGLYEAVAQGEFVEELDEWMFEGDRQPGDVELIRHEGDVESTSAYWGYHIIYFQGWDEAEWMQTVRSQLQSEDYTQWQEGLVEGDAYAASLGDGAKYLGT